MAADGVSLPQTIAQMGSVAKTQAKSQQPANQVTPFSEQMDNKDELKLQRIQALQETAQQKINADEDSKDRRQRRKLKRNRKRYGEDDSDPAAGGDLAAAGGADPDSDEEAEQLGALIDLRV